MQISSSGMKEERKEEKNEKEHFRKNYTHFFLIGIFLIFPKTE